MLQGRIPEAIRLFRDATLANPRHAPAWRGLGLANERLGRRPEAARAYERYLTFAPNAPDAAEVRRRLGDLR
jgi:Flp pilus assembly protein TadD